jgi:hypothetical protein
MASVSGASVQLYDWNHLVSIRPFNLLGLPLLASNDRLSLNLYHGLSEDRPVPFRVLQLETVPIGL